MSSQSGHFVDGLVLPVPTRVPQVDLVQTVPMGCDHFV